MISWRVCPRCGYPTAPDKFELPEDGIGPEVCIYCLRKQEIEGIIKEADPKDLLGLRVIETRRPMENPGRRERE